MVANATFLPRKKFASFCPIPELCREINNRFAMDKANYSFFVTFVQADLQPTNEARAKQSHLFCLARRRKSRAQPTNEARAEQNLFELCLARRKAEGQYDYTEKGNCNPQLKDRANDEGLQIPPFNAAGLQIRPNGVLSWLQLF